LEKHTVEREFVLKENFYCKECGGWIYCPEMNMKGKNDQGEPIEDIGEGCLTKGEGGDFFACPDCGCRHYLEG